MNTDPRPIIKSRWLEMLTYCEARGLVWDNPHYNSLLNIGLEHGWINPETGHLHTDETALEEAA